ncbi:tetratricopeptide repeat protein [Paractinoplanes ferrugineus]|uniref:NTPase n=1 Tax=Paractinoplanes ferrugineus TaxID=113564 RepID=A0A919J7Q6_9ACTN|nr:tetratricopeptide repeat protein [Actinoplanes ferrugineus]GIE14847.1 NTPase [Actinoplanes ferrugineus]
MTRPGNDLSGVVFGPSIQAVDINGGVHFHGVPPPPSLVPRQAAAPPPHFAGRAAELAEMRAALDLGSTVVILTGPGGVGKSALARQWGRLAADAFPDGQLSLTLSGFGPGPPLDPAEALRYFLRALGFGAGGLPATLAELTAMYRSVTAGLRLLVVLDDTYSVAQARVLVPTSATSMTVVVSRSRLSGLVAEGAVLVDVAPMTRAESLALLANVLGRARIDREPEQAGRLAELCAGLPIALCLAAARLSTRPRLSLARAVEALASETDRLARLETPDEEASVSGSFELSYQALDPPAAALYRGLALHPGREFGPGPAVGLAGSEAERLIDVLLEVNLLQEVAEERFRFHDLILLHARQKATGAEAATALTAILEWYLAAASAADVVATPYRRRLPYSYRTVPAGLPVLDDRDRALTWLDAERVNLGAAGQAALDRGWAELAWQLTDVLWPLQLYRKSTDRKEIDARGLAAARLWGEPRAEGRMLKRLGRTCSTLGEHEAAEELLREAIEKYAGDPENQVEAREMLALAYRDTGRAGAAIEQLRAVLALRRRLGHSRDIALTLINLGDLVSGREAIDLLREAGRLLDLSVAADPYNPVRVKLSLARAYLAGGDLAAADRAASEAAGDMRRLGVEAGEAEALELCAWIAARHGDVARNRLLLQQAAKLLEAHGSPRAAAVRRQLAAPPGVEGTGQRAGIPSEGEP